MGRIADVLRARGEIEEALRVFRAEVLPVFERLGDVRSMAVTMGRIADVLEDRGDLDEALRIRREEMLPVFERLGDARFMAETLQKIQAVQPEGSSQDTSRKTLKKVYGGAAESKLISSQTFKFLRAVMTNRQCPRHSREKNLLSQEKGVTADETERFLDPSFYYGHYAAGDIPDPGELIPDDVPLEEHESYTLEIAIRAETIGIDRNTKAPTGIKPSREGKETVAVYARVKSRDEKVLSFEDGFLPIDWAHDKDSERAFFRFETHPAQRRARFGRYRYTDLQQRTASLGRTNDPRHRCGRRFRWQTPIQALALQAARRTVTGRWRGDSRPVAADQRRASRLLYRGHIEGLGRTLRTRSRWVG